MRKIILITLLLLNNAFVYAGEDISLVPGSVIIPDNPQEVRLEEIYITGEGYHESGGTLYKSSYVFKNLSQKSATIKMWYPVLKGFYLKDVPFKLTVEGDPVHVLMRSDVHIKGIHTDRGDFVYEWEIVFKPQEKKVLELEYITKWEVSVESYPLDQMYKIYSNLLGLWNQSIQLAIFEVKLDKSILQGLNEKELQLLVTPVDYEIVNNKLIWKYAEWEPKENFIIETIKPDNKKIITSYFQRKEFGGDKRVYTMKDLQVSLLNTHKSFNDIKIAFARVLRNEIFARHGRIFKSEDLREIFESTDWYKPDPSYSDDMLNDIEKRNVQFILDYEKKMGWR